MMSNTLVSRVTDLDTWMVTEVNVNAELAFRHLFGKDVNFDTVISVMSPCVLSCS